MRMRPFCFAAVLALPLTLSACFDQPTDPIETGSIRVDMAVVPSGPFRCGAQVPVSATATNAKGRPVAGLLLNFNILEGGGSMYGGAALTDSRGVAGDLWTLGAVANVPNTMAVRGVSSALVATEYATATVTVPGRIGFSAVENSNWEIFTMEVDGTNPLNLTSSSTSDDMSPAWSPDGSRIAFVRRVAQVPGEDICVMNADGSNLTQLTTSGSSHAFPAWSPDGTGIVYTSHTSETDPTFTTWVMGADGSNPTRVGMGWQEYPRWSPDGTRIAYTSVDDGWYLQIYLMDANGANATKLTSSGSNWWANWAPDGQKLLFSSDRDGHGQIYVMNADGSNQVNLSNTLSTYDELPRWSPDGGTIIFHRSAGPGTPSDFYVMAADGSGQTRIIDNYVYTWEASWTGCLRP